MRNKKSEIGTKKSVLRNKKSANNFHKRKVRSEKSKLRLSKSPEEMQDLPLKSSKDPAKHKSIVLYFAIENEKTHPALNMPGGFLCAYQIIIHSFPNRSSSVKTFSVSSEIPKFPSPVPFSTGLTVS